MSAEADLHCVPVAWHSARHAMGAQCVLIDTWELTNAVPFFMTFH